MLKLKHEDTFFNLNDTGHFYLSTEKSSREEYAYAHINTNLSIFGNFEAEYQGRAITATIDHFTTKKVHADDNGAEISFGLTTFPATVTEKIEFTKGANVFSQRTEVTNDGDKPLRLSRLSAATVTGIGIDGGKYFDNDRFTVHYCYNHWQGEGQWRTASLKDLGIYPVCEHPWEKETYRFQSTTSSWCTASYYPLLIIEDKEKGECWFFEREGAENWYMEIYVYEGLHTPFINVAVGIDDALGWTYDLKPNETYSSSTAFYGVVKGGFEDAVRELLKYKRAVSLANADIEVAFNDFMNCYWAQPSDKRLIPLIDAAKKVGVQTFCIDDGWAVTGEWVPLEEKFGDYGFDGVIDYMKKNGLRPGVWFEFENTTHKEAQNKGSDFLRKRDGYVVTSHRPKLNMRSKEAREWLFDRIDRVYKAGVRYIKNDHNNHEGIGSDICGESPAEGTKLNALAFYDFVEEVKKRYPDLIIENCGAGAMREDNGTLKHFFLQSTTDQEDYRYYPSILIGQMACIPPEKAGVWGYPIPCLYKDLWSFTVPAEELESFKDGRQTIFNMVTAMMGYMYLSGRIDLADEFNLSLIKEAVSTYKTYKDTIKNRFPAFVLPMKTVEDKSFNAFGLIDRGLDMILSVWALEQKEFEIDLTKYGFSNLEKLYPSKVDNCEFSYKDGKLRLKFNDNYSAALFRLK